MGEKYFFTRYVKANYVLGGTAGVLATTCVQPMDLVKTRMQLRYLVEKVGNL